MIFTPDVHLDAQKSFRVLRTSLGYPDVPLPTIRAWDRTGSKYRPVSFTTEKVLELGVDPEHPDWDVVWERAQRLTSATHLQRDTKGRTLNPAGATGIAGRGKLYYWGPNLTADACLTRETDHGIQILLIHRKDTGQLAVPGGFRDGDEPSFVTASRELAEETGLFCDFSLVQVPLLSGVAKRALRNTDHAWIESSVHHFHCSKAYGATLEPAAGDHDDAKDAMWYDLDAVDTAGMSDAHGVYVDVIRRRLRVGPHQTVM